MTWSPLNDLVFWKVSIKRPGLLKSLYQTTSTISDFVEFFQRDSIKRPGPSQFYVQLQKIVLSLLNDLVSFKGPGLYLTTWSIFFEISNMRTISGLTILSNDLVSILMTISDKSDLVWNFAKETLLKDQVHLNFMSSYKRTSCFY